VSDHFLSPEKLLAGGPRGLLRATKRLLLHRGFEDVQVIDGANDGGADLLATIQGKLWVVQCKFTISKTIDREGVLDCDRALRKYKGDHSLLVTNSSLSKSALDLLQNFKDFSVPISVLDGIALIREWETLPEDSRNKFPGRPYQLEACDRIIEDLQERRSALLVMATGLGKSAVGGLIAARALQDGKKNILVLAHLKELVEQLEESFWPFLPKHVGSTFLHGDSPAQAHLMGLVVATPDAALKLDDYTPELIIIDEAHHVSTDGMYARILNYWADTPKLGLTATPWRGDKFDIQSTFGPASFKMGLAEGMAQGWLSEVNYKIFADNIDWEVIQNQSLNGYTVGQLNKLLFLDERDERIAEELLKVWERTVSPQAIVFCATIEHAERMVQILKDFNPVWETARVLHSGMGKRERQVSLNDFRTKRCRLIACVDVFNEGVDVPDVSIIAFLRVTHSRRIFVQQIGRGLRLSATKAKLEVLDFVTDVRRLKEISDLKAEYRGEVEVLGRPAKSSIEFANEAEGKIIEAWLRDIADLETEADEVHLNYPDPSVSDAD
jgi:superfamily II DNA or RNA helicase